MEKILIVDDNEVNRYTLGKIITGAGYEVFTAKNGKEGLKLFKDRRPDLLITDLQMPVMDGFELAGQIRLNRSSEHIPIIFISATYTDLASKIKAMDIGGNDYLTQPVDTDELLFKVKSMLRVKGLYDEHLYAKEEREKLLHDLQTHQIELEMQNNELQKAHSTLEQSRSRYADLYDFAPVGYFTFDKNGMVLEVNLTGAGLLVINRQQLIRKPFRNYITKEDQDLFYQHLKSVFQSKTKQKCEIRIMRKNDKELHVLLESMPVKNNEDNVIQIRSAITDITERREIEEKLHLNLLQLRKANEALSDFAYIVSHDLKEPIRAVHSLAKWLLSDYADKFDAAGKEKIDLLISRIRRMNDLVEGILQYSRAGRLIMEKSVIDLNQLVSEVTDMLCPGKNIHIQRDGTLPVIMAERSSIQQIFQNLINNAIKYTDKPRPEIKIRAENDRAFWKICVSDNGPGIEEKDHEKIFQMFSVLQPRDKIEASGVGLAVVKKIVEMYGGKLWVDSKVGKGSRFYFTIPK